jgi:SAM-dependent methyltransferase
MTLAQHTDYRIRYQQQLDNAREYVLPFIESVAPVHPGMKVMDIGCGEGGVLMPFLDKGCMAVGIELDALKSGYARELLSVPITQGQVDIVNQNIYEEEALKTYRGQFDLILLKDVIEHIPDQERFIPYLRQFLKPGGYLFFGFPPWYMPHGGHQQVCSSRFLSMLPWFHLLPNPLYRGILRMFGEDRAVIGELLENKSTGISIERFERIVRKSKYTIAARTWYLVNPIYQQKFGLRPMKQFGIVSAIPWFRDFFTTCAYYLIRT